MDKDWWHGFFGMTRTERIGAYAMLVIMTLTVTIAFTFRSCSTGDSDVHKARELLKRSEMAQQMRDSIYKAKMDSANVVASKKKNAKKDKKAKKLNRTYEDRDLQEVPQF